MAAFRNNQNRGNETLAAAVTDVSDRVTRLIREEIELAKAETLAKVASLARGLVAVGAGAVFGVFALVMGLITLGWALNSLIAGTGKIWIGFGIVFVVLLALTAGAFLFAWRKLKVGAPTPKMAIDEAKKITATVRNGHGNGTASVQAAPALPVASGAPATAPVPAAPPAPAASPVPPASAPVAQDSPTEVRS